MLLLTLDGKAERKGISLFSGDRIKIYIKSESPFFYIFSIFKLSPFHISPQILSANTPEGTMLTHAAYRYFYVCVPSLDERKREKQKETMYQVEKCPLMGVR